MKRFLDFPFQLYRHTPQWVPPFASDAQRMLDRKKHPFYRHSAAKFFIARQADRVVAEVNQGGDMVAAMLKSVDAALPLLTVRASRGKVARAEPVAALYGEGRVFHAGVFPALEDELCGLLADGRYAGPGRLPIGPMPASGR